MSLRKISTTVKSPKASKYQTLGYSSSNADKLAIAEDLEVRNVEKKNTNFNSVSRSKEKGIRVGQLQSQGKRKAGKKKYFADDRSYSIASINSHDDLRE